MNRLQLPENHRYIDGRVCTLCKVFKHSDDYEREKDKRCIGGVAMRSICKPCDEPRKRKADLKRHYNMTPQQYDDLNTKQNGMCAICGATDCNNSRANSRLFIDHDHTTGAIRGLLCSNCNHALGHFRDNVEILSKAIAYLYLHNDIKDN